MDLSPEERALIEFLRSDRTFRLHFQRRADHWSITTAPAMPEQHPQNTSGGRTFAEAWALSRRPIP